MSSRTSERVRAPLYSDVKDDILLRENYSRTLFYLAGLFFLLNLYVYDTLFGFLPQVSLPVTILYFFIYFRLVKWHKTYINLMKILERNKHYKAQFGYVKITNWNYQRIIDMVFFHLALGIILYARFFEIGFTTLEVMFIQLMFLLPYLKTLIRASVIVYEDHGNFENHARNVKRGYNSLHNIYERRKNNNYQ
ncbi:MAG: hypothetical protein QM489_02870 [Candidatus Izemoplasma sp.]